MAISTTIRKIQFDTSGGFIASYPFAFKFWDETEIKATLSTPTGDVGLAYGVDYSISTPGDSGTLTRIITAAWVTATQLTIYRQLDLTQEVVLVNGGTQDADIYMQMVDRNVAMAQESDEVLDRLVRFPITDSGVSPDLPDADTRKGKFLAFDVTTGDPIAASGGMTVPCSAYMATVVDDADAISAQKTLAILPAASASAFDAVLVQAAGAAIKATIENIGLTYDAGNIPTLYARALIGNRYNLGDIVTNDCILTPGVDMPVVDRSVDNDITTAHYPTLVPYLRAQKAKIQGVTDFSVTVSGSTITFPNNAPGIAAVSLIINDATVSGWLNAGQPATVPAADYTTAATKRCVTIGGVEYPITGATLVSREVTVTGTPASGAQTASLYTYRITGSATSARLHKIAGFVGVVAGEADGVVVGGFRKMDQGQIHEHMIYGSNGAAGAVALVQMNTNLLQNLNVNIGALGSSIVAGSGGTPRVGKTNDPRTIGLNVYTWSKVYL